MRMNVLTKTGSPDILVTMRKIIIAIVLVLFFSPSVWAKSVVRQGEPFVKFHKISVPKAVEQGEMYKIEAEIEVQKSIMEDMGVFFHIIDQKDGKIWINNSFRPSIPSIQWTVGERVRLGPVNGYIPEGLSPGTYGVHLGLYTTKTTDTETTYIREPYINPEIKDFIVGTIEVAKKKQDMQQEKKEDLVISDFESEIDLRKWQLNSSAAELDAENTVEGKSAAKITYRRNMGCCPSVKLESFLKYSNPKYSNWTDYDILQFYVYGPKDGEGHTYLNCPVSLLVKDKSERRYLLALPNTYEKDKPVTIVLSNIGKAADLADIGSFGFFVGGTPVDKDLVMYLDDVRLIFLGESRTKGPFIKFEGLKISKDKVKPNEEIEIEPAFSTSQRFTEDYGIFIHVYRSVDYQGRYSVNINPSLPTSQWEVGKVVFQGPFSIYIPSDSPPGKYSVEVGLFVERQIPQGANYVKYHRRKDGSYSVEQPSYPQDYFKQEYVNYQEYGDWVVGAFEVTAP